MTVFFPQLSHKKITDFGDGFDVFDLNNLEEPSPTSKQTIKDDFKRFCKKLQPSLSEVMMLPCNKGVTIAISPKLRGLWLVCHESAEKAKGRFMNVLFVRNFSSKKKKKVQQNRREVPGEEGVPRGFHLQRLDTDALKR